MNTEQKNQLKQTMETIVKAMERWEKAREIAKDIIAYVDNDPRRFKIEVDIAVGLRILRIKLVGTEMYVYYGESSSEMSIKQIYERFFSDNNALVNMISKLADAVLEVAEQNIKELEKQLE